MASWVEQLPVSLQREGSHLLELGTVLRSLRNLCSLEEIDKKQLWIGSVNEQRGSFEQKLLILKQEIKCDVDFDDNQLQSKWEQFRKAMVACNSAFFENSPSSNEGLRNMVDEFAGVRDKFESMALKNNIQIPWQFMYCGERDPADNAPIDFSGGVIVDEHGRSIFEDLCCVCGISIQHGLLYGVGIPRVHCLDCGVAICTLCHAHISDLYTWSESSVLSDQRRSSLQNALSTLHPHMHHCTAVENNQFVILRNTIFSRPYSFQTIICRLFKSYASRLCCNTILNHSMDISYSTYAKEFDRIKQLSKALHALIQNPLERVGISFSGSRLWYNFEIAILLQRCVSTGIPNVWNAEDWVGVANRASITIAVIDNAVFQQLQTLQSSIWMRVQSLRCIIIVDEILVANDPTDWSSFISSSTMPGKTDGSSRPVDTNGQVLTFSQFLSCGSDVPEDEIVIQGQDTDPAVIVHSSGTTGAPKGVIYTVSQCLSDFDVASYDLPLVEISTFPPCWGTSKMGFWRTLLNGGRVSFVHDTMLSASIFDCYRLVNPTSIILMPSVALAVQAEFHTAFDNALLWLSTTSGSGCDGHSRSHKEDFVHTKATALAAAHSSDCFGKRCRAIGVGGGKSPTSLREFLQSVLDCPVVDAYGTSESSGIATNGYINSGVEVKLVDRPELGYTNADVPYPRGEIAVRSNSQVAQENWLCTEAESIRVADRYISDGYFLTGDIGCMPSSKEVHVVDRISHVVKMANGCWLSPDTVEIILLQCPMVQSVLVVPNRSCTLVVAVVVPAQTLEYGIHCLSIASLKLEFDVLLKDAGLPTWMYPRHIIQETQRWSQENGSLLYNMKVDRRGIIMRHSHALSDDYVDAALASTVPPGNVREDKSSEKLFCELISDVTGIDVDNLRSDTTLSAFGVDSIALIQLYRTLSSPRLYPMIGLQKCRPIRLSMADVAASTTIMLFHRVVENAANAVIISWASEEPLSGTGACTSSDCKDAARDKHTDVVATAAVTEDVITNARIEQDICEVVTSIAETFGAEMCPVGTDSSSSSAIPPSNSNTVVVVGGSGYFGRYLVCKLLLISLASPVRVVCLVRGSTNQIALERLLISLLQTKLLDRDQLNTFISKGLLWCYCGDMQENDCWSKVCASDPEAESLLAGASVVINAAAAVKFLSVEAGYDLLFGANVLTVKNLILFMAMNMPCARLVHISTMGVASSSLVQAVSAVHDKSVHSRMESVGGLHSDRAVSMETMAVKYDANVDAYTLTKAIAEVLIHRTEYMGLYSMSTKPLIVRLPLLTWASNGGAANDDWLLRLLSTSHALQLYPEHTEHHQWALPIHHLPVDLSCDVLMAYLYPTGDEVAKLNAAASIEPNENVRCVNLIHDKLKLVVFEVLEEVRRLSLGGMDGMHGEPQVVSCHSWLYAVRTSKFLSFAPLAEYFPTLQDHFVRIQHSAASQVQSNSSTTRAAGGINSSELLIAAFRQALENRNRRCDELCWKVGLNYVIASLGPKY